MELLSKTQLKPQSKPENKQFTYTVATIVAPGKVEFDTASMSKMLPDQLLVRMEGTGLCASNIPVWEGREWFSYPLPQGQPGHEGWGIVERVGSQVTDFQIGDRVAILHGSAFAEYAMVSQKNAVMIADELAGVPFPGEALGCLMNILKRADIQKGQTVAVLGLGFIGMGMLQLLVPEEVRIVAVSRRKDAIQYARQYTDYVYKAENKYAVADEIMRLTQGKGCDRVIECTGHQDPLDMATEIISEYGKLIIAGYHQDGLRHIDLQKWNWKAIDVINAHERNTQRYCEGIASAVAAVQSGILDPKALISHAFQFQKLADGLNHLAENPEGLIKSYVFYT